MGLAWTLLLALQLMVAWRFDRLASWSTATGLSIAVSGVLLAVALARPVEGDRIRRVAMTAAWAAIFVTLVALVADIATTSWASTR